MSHPTRRRRLTTQILFFSIFILITGNMHAQQNDRLSIAEAYQLAKKNYPMIKQRDLVSRTREYSVSNVLKGYLPVFSVNGQATYQSAVTTFPFKVPIPGFTLPNYSKDQYKIYAEVDQVLYDGGIIKNQRQSAEAVESVQQQDLEIQLYSIYDRVNQLFFGILLIDEQIKLNSLLRDDVQNGIDKTKALLENGTVFRSSLDELSAQLLQTEQARIELAASRKAYVDMLLLFINRPAAVSLTLENPPAPGLPDSINRPELSLYQYRKKTYDLQEALLDAQLRPKFSLFLQGGYGRPGLDFLDNSFAWYYIGGIRLNWNLGSLYTLKNQKRLLDINKNALDVENETFLFNTGITRNQQRADLEKYPELLKNDERIVALRESVKKAAAAQLENGVLNAHDYLTQVNLEDQARQNLVLHQVLFTQSQYNYLNTMGNQPNYNSH